MLARQLAMSSGFYLNNRSICWSGHCTWRILDQLKYLMQQRKKATSALERSRNMAKGHVTPEMRNGEERVEWSGP